MGIEQMVNAVLGKVAPALSGIIGVIDGLYQNYMSFQDEVKTYFKDTGMYSLIGAGIGGLLLGGTAAYLGYLIGAPLLSAFVGGATMGAIGGGLYGAFLSQIYSGARLATKYLIRKPISYLASPSKS